MQVLLVWIKLWQSQFDLKHLDHAVQGHMHGLERLKQAAAIVCQAAQA